MSSPVRHFSSLNGDMSSRHMEIMGDAVLNVECSVHSTTSVVKMKMLAIFFVDAYRIVGCSRFVAFPFLFF